MDIFEIYEEKTREILIKFDLLSPFKKQSYFFQYSSQSLF